MAGAAAGNGVRITAVDTSAYPSVRVTVVTPQPAAKAPKLSEDGRPVTGFTAKNFGREKSVVLLFDRSQSMLGRAMQDATAAARSFVRSKPASDRIAIVAVGKQAFQLTPFSSGTSEADSALRGLEVDKVRGTALYDAVILSSDLLASDVHQSRVVVLVTDGQEVSSKASLDDAIAAANKARVTVYPIGIESASFKPGPLKRLAAETGGRYSGAAGTASLQAIYASLAQELRRTWQLTYFTTARRHVRAQRRRGAHHGVGAGDPSRSRDGVVRAGPRVRRRPDARGDAGRRLHPHRRDFPLEGAGRSRAAPPARAAHR
jgi:VWFA-related protein